MRITRRKSKIIRIGKVIIGGNHPIAIQSMAKTRTADIEKTIREIKELERVGCEIVRLAVRDNHDARALKRIKEKVKLPIVADIHFNWRLALEAIDSGVDKIRLNPGNIYKEEQIREVVSALKAAGIPLRIGVNSGSVRELNSKRLSMADRLVKSSLNYIRVIEKFKFSDIVVSLKASNVLDTIEAYRKIVKLCDYPLHLGVTATGSSYAGAIKSSLCLGALLLEGIGDTIRISLTDESVNEVKAAKIILESLGLRSFSPQIISCPTCGRCEVDLPKLVKELEESISRNYSILQQASTAKPIKVAIMGCVVNGPGEAAQADIGVAFGKGRGLLFKKGKPVRKVSFAECKDTLLKEILKG